MYDAIVVGARVAGSPTAMLLARRGLKVLLARPGALPERHALDASGAGAGGRPARRWGLLERLGGTPGRGACASTPGRWSSRGGGRRSTDRRADEPAPHAARRGTGRRRARRRRRSARGLRGRRAPVRGRPGHRCPQRLPTRARAGSSSGADGRHSRVAKAVGAARLPRRPRALGRVLHVLVGRAPRAAGDVRARASHDRRLADERRARDDLRRRSGRRVPRVPRRSRGPPAAVARPAPRPRRARARRRARRAVSTAPPTPARALPTSLRPGLGAASATPGCGWTRSPATGSPTRSATPSGWRRRSAGDAQLRRTTARAATRRRSRCTR
jgi:hypothetical protein